MSAKGTGCQVLRINCPSFETIDMRGDDGNIKSPSSTLGSPFLIQMSDIPICTTTTTTNLTDNLNDK